MNCPALRRLALFLTCTAGLLCGCAGRPAVPLASGDCALHAGQLKRAQAYYLQALAKAEALPVNRSAQIAALNSLVTVELAQGKTAAAERHGRRAVAAIETCASVCAPSALTTALFNLASITATLGKADEAEALYARAAAAAEKIPDFDALELSERLSELGQFQLARGHYAEAEAAYTSALAKREKAAAGRQDPAIAPLLEDLAAALQGQQKAREAQAVEQRARALGGWRR